jgi:polygalacturonase
VINERGHGCQTWIVADHAPGSGVMGEGAIDGRGGAKLPGQDVTWWDLDLVAGAVDLAVFE